MPLGQPGTPRDTRLRADPPVDVPVRTTLDILLLESTVIWASATALLGEEGRLSYADLMVRAQNIATLLRRKGMRHGDLVGVIGTRTFNAICSIIGILLAGGVYVPFDVYEKSAEKLSRQLDASAVQLMMADRSDAAANALPWAHHVTVIDSSVVEREFMPMFRDVRLAHRLPEDPAAVVFNEEGHGVLVTHAGVVRLVTAASVMEFRSFDTMLLHSGAQEHAFQLELWGPLLAGGTVALALHPDAGESLSPQNYARMIRRFRVNSLCARPRLLEELAREPLAPLAQVQQVVVDAAGLQPVELQRLRHTERGMRVVGGLGAAETTSYAITVAIDVEHAGDAEAVPGSEALVVLPNGREAKKGTLGSLAITGDALAIGYLGEPAATLAAFTEVQRENNQRLRCFRLPVQGTRLTDGRLLIGPPAVAAAEEAKTHQPRKVSAGEIEVLLAKHPLVRECVALSDAHGDRVSCVFVTLKQGGDPLAERTLREYLETHLPADQQPAALLLVPHFLLDAQGRPDRGPLREQCEVVLRKFTPSSRPPETRPERQADVVRSIWQRLLHRMQVDMDEDFFASGGTPVQRIRLYAELNQRFPGAFTMAELRSLNTLRKVTEHLGSDVARERMMALERRGA
jgi:nonribosomal peptide synthetase DhbF